MVDSAGMKKPSALQQKLKASDPDVRAYGRALQAENLKLHRQIAKLQADKLSKQNRVKSLEKELQKRAKKDHISVQLVHYGQSKT